MPSAHEKTSLKAHSSNVLAQSAATVEQGFAAASTGDAAAGGDGSDGVSAGTAPAAGPGDAAPCASAASEAAATGQALGGVGSTAAAPSFSAPSEAISGGSSQQADSRPWWQRDGPVTAGDRPQSGGDQRVFTGSFFYYGSPDLPEGVTPGTVEARIYNLVNRYSGAFKIMHLLEAPAFLPLFGTDLVTGQRPPAPVPNSFWRGVVRQLELTQQQREDVLGMRGLHAKYTDSIMAERLQLQARLAGVGIGSSDAGADPLEVGSAAAIAAMEVAEALAANMKKEKNIT
ncbi:hypothetical protein MNEG_8674 [Monoraphidium neglectum]|uniref:Uncharacterized protein n=1 Tax=Monoraphidium neglectum TaxID=145388 RepID=A0A0D2MEW9_9CHLO|nr:hypothetical protein MNEG_8674 [Monoraphidium neglectum]KIY99286.1 hypothetical protein MNEG_8674 [Monoraphidium neglectum]|eukprot:XP_013898306.1 hypothetical protein MNEG_8674 [Monoraphidium neglectum]